MSFRERAHNVASIQAQQAIKLLDRTREDWLWPPWQSLGEITGGIASGGVWFVGGFSGDGKTTWLMSAVDLWYEQGKRIYYLGTETRPVTLITRWACQRLGMDAGQVLKGQAISWPDWPDRRKELAAMIRGFQESHTAAQVHFSPVQFVDGVELVTAMKNAADFGADVFILDHVDHVQGERDPFQVSREVCQTILTYAQSLGLHCVIATQFNNEAVRNNRLARYQPPQPHYVYMGGHKRMVAEVMLGLYRPLRKGVETDALRDFQRGVLEPQDVCEPHTMGIAVMKDRNGSYDGRRVLLRVERGRVIEPPIHEDTSWNV